MFDGLLRVSVCADVSAGSLWEHAATKLPRQGGDALLRLETKQQRGGVFTALE